MKFLKTLIIQNDPSVPPGIISRWFSNFDLVRAYQDRIPNLSQYQLVILCGGEPNVMEESKYPWLVTLKYELRQSLLYSSTKFLGLCLGGQLCAEALGAKIYLHPKGTKIGWESVETSESGSIDFFHYHRYIFDLPENAQRIAKNNWWVNQGFIWRNQVLAVQFHPEAEAPWIADCLDLKMLPESHTSMIEKSQSWLRHELDKLIKNS